MGQCPSADLLEEGWGLRQLMGLGMGGGVVGVLVESVSWRNIISQPPKTRSVVGLLNQASWLTPHLPL